MVDAVKSHVSDVLVIDDASSDDTPKAAERTGARVLRLEVNGGKGRALRTGLAELGERGFEWALLMDGDGQHAPEDVPAFLERAERGDTDLIIGNRMGDTAAMPWLRRRVNRWMSRRISTLAGMELPDTQCGFRLVRLEAWERVDCAADRFEIESEMLIEFVRRGFRVDFVPVRTIYKRERSKISPWRDTVRWLRWWRGARQARAFRLPDAARAQHGSGAHDV